MVRRRSAPVLFVLLCTALAAPMPAAADRFVAARPGGAVRLLAPHGPLRCSAAGTWVPVGARVARRATIRAITARLMLASHPVPGARSAWRSPRGIVRDHLHVPSCGVRVELLYTITARNGHHQRRSFAVGVARPPGRAVLFVGNVEDGTVTLVDERSLSTIRTIDVTPDGKTPQDPGQAAIYPALVQAKGVDYVQGLAVSPDGATLYVSRGYLGDVAAFDMASGALLWRQQIAGVRADHIALSPDGRRLFVSALTANEVQVIDTHTHAIVGQFATGDWPHVLEFSPDGRELVNGSLGNQLLPAGAPTKRQITIADPMTLKVLRTIPFSA